ncbi:MAG: S8 family serine peptidase [Armatimonadota bacterium]|nr:S8 family serine peptidase [Armatimonadota bacterium]
MNESRNRQRGRARLLVVAVALLIVCIVPCVSGTLETMPQYVPNQLMVTLKPGSTSADMQAIADAQGMTILKSVPVPNTYLVKWTRTESVESKATKVLAYPAVQMVSPNHYHRKFASTPNDPRFPEQWHYAMISMPLVWDIEKGKDTVTVAVVDDGISTTHPDIIDRLVPGTDIANGDTDPNYMAGAIEAGHGLHVAGTVAATTDNGIGVAGVCWSGVKIMPVKVFADDAPFTSDDIIIEGLTWARANGANVVNMSLGGATYNAAFQAKVTELINAGIVIVASAGNEYRSPVSYPAAYDGVIAVSAVNRLGVLTSYSNIGPQISVAAPGGEPPDGVLSTYWESDTNTYAFLMGTSMASPHVAGAVAILLSSGVAPSDVKAVLELSAKPVGSSRPNNMYGWGIIDVHSALTSGGGKATILEPLSGQKIDTKLPRFKIRMFNAKKSSIKVYLGSNIDIDGDSIPDDASAPIIDSTNIDTYYDESSGIMSFQLAKSGVTYPVSARNPLLVDEPLATQAYRIAVIADSKSGLGTTGITGWCMFRIQPKSQPAGLRLASVPYPLVKSVTDPRIATQQFYGTNGYKMARWLPTIGAYARLNYSGVISDARASLFPPDSGVHPHSASNVTSPAGLGYWLDFQAQTPLIADTFVDDLDAYDIPVVAGWNMIGDPFPFQVDWNSLMVTYQGRTLTIGEAVTAGWLRPALYRYTTAGYTYESLPGGTLIPWEGNWIRVLKGTAADPMVLSVPPVVSQVVTRNAAVSSGGRLIGNRSTATGADWTISLSVEAGDARDEQNLIGSAPKSTDGYDAADVESPPVPARFVDLSFPHRDWAGNSGVYAADIRSPLRGPAKVWEFEVKTNLPRADVRITWPDVSSAPETCAFTLQDLQSGKRVSLREATAYVYNSGIKPGTRRFRLSARAGDATRVALTGRDR